MPRTRKDRVDNNQAEIVKELRARGFSVVTGMDDIIVGTYGCNFWYELKDPETALNKDGEIKESAKEPSQKRLEKEFKGHYRIIHSLEQILDDIELELSDPIIPPKQAE